MNETPWPFPMHKPPTPAIAIRRVRENLANFIQPKIDSASLLNARAVKEGVGIVHIFDQTNPKGGLTVAFRKTMPHHSSTNMVEVAVVTCSEADTFSRKIGTPLALAAFFVGKTITLPLSSGWKTADLNSEVKDAFSAMWYSNRL